MAAQPNTDNNTDSHLEYKKKRRRPTLEVFHLNSYLGYFHKHKLQLKYLPTLTSLILGNIFLSVLNTSCVHCLSDSPPPPPGYFQKHKLQVKYLPTLNILILGNTFLSVLNLSCILCLSATPLKIAFWWNIYRKMNCSPRQQPSHRILHWQGTRAFKKARPRLVSMHLSCSYLLTVTCIYI